MSNAKAAMVERGFEAALELVLGEKVTSREVGQGDLRAARLLIDALGGLQPTPAARERAMWKVRERMSAGPQPRAWWGIGPIPASEHLRAISIALVLLIGFAVGGAYALPVLLPQVFDLIDRPAVEILQSGRAHELSLASTAGGITITADRAYVDDQRILVQFTVLNPPTDPGQPVSGGTKVRAPLTTGGSVTLTDPAGRTYRVVRGAESPLVSGAEWNGEPLVAIYSFDASQIPAAAQLVSLELTIAELRGVPDPSGVTHVLPGPWTFTFSAPVSR